MNIIDKLKKLIETNNDVLSGELLGCSIDEINLLEERFKYKLPSTYVDFLTLMGKESAGTLDYTAIYYTELDYMNEIVKKLANENNYTLPKNIFVFSNNQDYGFKFFIVDAEVPDPDVFTLIFVEDIICENDNEILSIFLLNQVNYYINIAKYKKGLLKDFPSR